MEGVCPGGGVGRSLLGGTILFDTATQHLDQDHNLTVVLDALFDFHEPASHFIVLLI